MNAIRLGGSEMVGGGSGGRLARRLGREMMQLGAARMICRRRPPLWCGK